MTWPDLKSLIIMLSSWWLAGTYHVKLDAQGRLPFPRAFRRQIIELSRNELYLEVREQYLLVRSQYAFARTLEAIADLNDDSEEARELRRRFSSRVLMLSLDTQGRLKLPPQLLELPWIKGDLVIMGTGRDLEIRPAE